MKFENERHAHWSTAEGLVFEGEEEEEEEEEEDESPNVIANSLQLEL